MSTTYCSEILLALRNDRGLQLMKANYLADGMEAIFLNHHDMRFYEVNIKPYYGVKDGEVSKGS